VLLFECTRDFVEDSVNVEGISSYVRHCLMKSFLISEKYIALKWKSQIKIWNRHSLKIEEVLGLFLLYLVFREKNSRIHFVPASEMKGVTNSNLAAACCLQASNPIGCR
jgi:hypothetical protein